MALEDNEGKTLCPLSQPTMKFTKYAVINSSHKIKLMLWQVSNKTLNQLK